MISVALPKGRLGESVYSLFDKCGYSVDPSLFSSRSLLFVNEEKGIRYFWVKPGDVPVYVERGVADLGVAGTDVLRERGCDLYELLDLGKGRCRLCVAAPKEWEDDENRVLRVATKYPGLSKEYYLSLGREIDIIKLNGSIEIAPLLGLSDVIVDIVETGTTLRENNLEVKNTVMDISAMLVANKASFFFHREEILRVNEKIAGVIREENKNENL
jgi:ATP phosphoribosyltransferase